MVDQESLLYIVKNVCQVLTACLHFTGSILLESKIQPHTAYQKQQVSSSEVCLLMVVLCSLIDSFVFQETLIVWSEGENYDLALSFQEKAGCDEIWEKICQVNIRSKSRTTRYNVTVARRIDLYQIGSCFTYIVRLRNMFFGSVE